MSIYICVYTVYIKQAFVVLLMLLFIKHLTSVCQCKTASVVISFNLTHSLVLRANLISWENVTIL